MQPGRYLVLTAAGLVLLGSLATTGGYAWYLRSAGYRQACVAYLSECLELPSDIGRVVPRSRRSREFDDVVVWLPDRRDRALYCRRALVVETPQPHDPAAYEIQLVGGTGEISTRTWLRSDYRVMVESGLRPGFAPGGPQRVTFSEMDLSFDHDGFQAALRHAGGLVWFEGTERGYAKVHCREFNGYTCTEPVFLQAAFAPHHQGIRVDRLELIVPRLPLAIVGLRGLFGPDVRAGTFNGRLLYEERDDGRSVTVSGECLELNLRECTTGLTPRPWRGRCPEITLNELRVHNDRPVRLRFAGVLTGVMLGDILATWGLGEVGGQFALRVGNAELSPAGIERFVASGQCSDLSLETLTQALGWGRMTGNLRVVIDDLTIENNHLKSLDATMIVDDAVQQPNWIEGKLLRELISRTLEVDLPDVLPERIEYTQLGVKLDVRDEVLHVFGTHGPREKTILTVRLAELEMPLIREPEQPFDLSGWFDKLRAQAAERLQRRLRSLPLPADTPDDRNPP